MSQVQEADLGWLKRRLQDTAFAALAESNIINAHRYLRDRPWLYEVAATLTEVAVYVRSVATYSRNAFSTTTQVPSNYLRVDDGLSNQRSGIFMMSTADQPAKCRKAMRTDGARRTIAGNHVDQ